MLKTQRTGLAALAAAALVAAFAACSNTATQIGGSLVEDETSVVILKDFPVTGHTVPNEQIPSRTITQMLGVIEARGYGQFRSDFVTQFMPAAKLPVDSIRSAEQIDSLLLCMAVPTGDLVGDSVVPMGLQVYALNKQLQTPIYSNFDPDGYYDPSAPLASAIYAPNALMATDSVKRLSYREIDVRLPRQMAVELYDLYRADPSAYATPGAFALKFPGLYVTNSYGAGRVINIGSTIMRLFYHTTATDSTGRDYQVSRHGAYYAVTPEIITNNCIDYAIAPELQARIDQGEKIMVAPAGRDLELTFPLREVIDAYHAQSGHLSVVNTLTMELPAEAISNVYGLDPPQSLLLVLKNQKREFFAKNKLTDSKTSFTADYNATKGSYTFTDMRGYLLDMLAKKEITDEDFTFCLTPVTVTTETNSSAQDYYYEYYYGGTSSVYVSAITPYVKAPAMCRFDLEKAAVTLTFSKQTVN